MVKIIYLEESQMRNNSSNNNFDHALSSIVRNKERRLEGDVIAIPWSLPRLATVLPGIEQGRYNLISASPKAGKTQLTDFLYVYQPIEWLINNPDSNISLKIFYFSLEVSIQSKYDAAMSYKLFKDHGIVISPQKLRSVFGGYILDDEVEEIIRSSSFKEWFNKFESIITYYDNVRNPYGIYNAVKSYAEHPDNGSYTYKPTNWQNKDGSYEVRDVIDKYIPVRPDEYVIVIIDHISLLQAEKNKNLHQSISQFSSEYCLRMRDRWGYIPVIVQQQTADSSKAQFNYRGDTVLDKIKPDPEGLADNKYTSRDADLMLSLFHPARYNIEDYKGINLANIGDSHRELMINLNRNGISNASIQLMFLGTSSYFAELPKEVDNNVEESIININNKAK